MTFPNQQDFADEKGFVNDYAYRVAIRSRADALYLSRWRVIGHDAAAQLTCEEYGHDARAGLCERCGSPVTAQQVRDERRALRK